MRLKVSLAALAAALLVSAPPVAADGRHGGDKHDGRSELKARALGKDLGFWIGRSWEAVLELPAEQSPLVGNGDPCVRLHERVVAPFGLPNAATECTVDKGTIVMLAMPGTECSSAERDTPFFGGTPEELAACLDRLDTRAVLTRLTVSVDGELTDILAAGERYFARSDVFTLDLPEGNVLSGQAERAIARAEGWAAFLKHLRPGRHEIVFRITGDASNSGGGPFDDTNTLIINVLRDRGEKGARRGD